ncbi:MAG: cell division protein FtsQ/DivIB [Mesorhizobium sp.]
MFALRSGQGGRRGAPRGAAFGVSSPVDGFVLPRWLRRPARLLSRLDDGEFAPPRFAATMATALYLGGFSLYGAYLGGHVPAIAQSVTARLGFAVDEVRVAGHRETSEIDILDRLGLDGWTALIGFDAEAARARIAELPWVSSVEVRKIYPDEIDVTIGERKPFAIWQHGRELAVIEESGNVIAPFSSERHATLPLVIGLGAPEGAAGFIATVRRYPELSSRVKGYVRVGERRWNLRLENGITVKLPEHDPVGAIEEVLALDKENGLLSRDISAVDLRLNDRLVVQLTPEAALRREAALKEKAKPGKKLERKI